MAVVILLLVAAAGLAFFLWSPTWLGPPERQAPGTPPDDGGGSQPQA